MKQSTRIFTVFLGVIFAAQTYAQTTIYQWTDSQGRVNYTQVNPEYIVHQEIQINTDEKAPLIPVQPRSQTKNTRGVKTFESSRVMLVNVKTPLVTPSEASVDPIVPESVSATEIKTEPAKTELRLALSDTDQSDRCTTAKHNLSTLEGYMDGKVNLLKLKNSDGTETTLTKSQAEVRKAQTLKDVDAYCVQK